MGVPYFVTAIDPEARRVVIGPPSELDRRWLEADQDNWLIEMPVDAPRSVEVQIRYNSSPVPATVVRHGAGGFRVEFEGPIQGVSPGQLAAVFEGSRALGCGWIRDTGV
jgi:tRNA-specific 2-thiouridylase